MALNFSPFLRWDAQGELVAPMVAARVPGLKLDLALFERLTSATGPITGLKAKITDLAEKGGKKIPEFAAGDTVIVNVNVVEGTRKRVQAYEGVVIAKRNRGLNSSFIVRKVSSGEGVERTFQLYSPLIAGIEVKRRGDVRRAKLYFLRERSGKSARIKEKLA